MGLNEIQVLIIGIVCLLLTLVSYSNVSGMGTADDRISDLERRIGELEAKINEHA